MPLIVDIHVMDDPFKFILSKLSNFNSPVKCYKHHTFVLLRVRILRALRPEEMNEKSIIISFDKRKENNEKNN